MAVHQLYTTASSPVPGTINETVLAEDVSSTISNLFPLEFPLHEWMSTRRAGSVFTEHPVKTFNDIARTAAMFGANPYAGFLRTEASTATSTAANYAAKLKSTLQISNELVEVSGTMRAVDLHGFNDRYVDAVEDKIKTVASNHELSYWYGPGSVAGGIDVDTGGGAVYLARATQGLFHWIAKSGLQRTKINATTGITDGNGNVFGSASGNVPLSLMTYCQDLNGVDMDRGHFFDLMSNWKLLGGQPDGCLIWASPRVKRLFGNFANTAIGPVNERKVAAADKVVYDTVSAYETDFGMHLLNMSYYLQIPGQSSTIEHSTGSTVCAWDEILLATMPRYYHIDTLRGLTVRPFTDAVDAYRATISAETGLACRNTLAGVGLVNAVST